MRVRGGPATVSRKAAGSADPGARRLRPLVPPTRGRGHPPEGIPRAPVVPVLRRRRPGRPAAGAAAQRGLPGRRRRAGARREGHRQVDGGARARRAAARGRRGRAAAASPATRPRPTPTCPDGPHDARRPARAPAGRAWSSCRSAPPRTGWSARWTSSGRSPTGSRRTSPACSPPRTAACSTSTRSTCCPTTWSTCCWTPPRWAGRTSSATACRSGTRPGSCWSAR